jgi:hypothetical protein
LNLRPLGYEPNELPGCSTPLVKYNAPVTWGQLVQCLFICLAESIAVEA